MSEEALMEVQESPKWKVLLTVLLLFVLDCASSTLICLDGLFYALRHRYAAQKAASAT